ncbi:MAG: ferrous iron transport protein B [Proteobacteria bacterium]|nr:ferrous iron transport protein B [Pseudomonadota bacterium]MBU1639061.1 ferrous iron transport protein B [Pseudomonadota bacterium]
MSNELTIALAGNPNAGKTTLFNALTGSRQHVGNYPGVTVDTKEGRYSKNGLSCRLVDLPGIYSLSPYSEEEVVARDYLVNQRPGVIINIVDASNLERNLYLSCQFMEMGVPMVIALNMIDVAKKRGIEIDHQRLSELIGLPVCPVVARSGQGISELMVAAIAHAREHSKWQPAKISYGEDLDAAMLDLSEMIKAADFLTQDYPARWTALKYLEKDDRHLSIGDSVNVEMSARLVEKVEQVSRHLEQTVGSEPDAMIADHRYGFIKSIVKQNVVHRTIDPDRLYASDRIDKVLTNRFAGPLIMLLVLLGLYNFTFTYSALPVAWCEAFFSWLGVVADTFVPDGYFKSMLIAGIIDGIGGVLGFVPLIMFMFFGIALLEDTGYLARVAFMMDRIFRIFGLHGSSVMAYIISGGIAGGCAVPGVMATRTLRSPKERMATLLTVPFMNCGAKLPVLALLVGAFFSENQARYMFLFTLLAWLMALLAAKLLRVTVLRGASTPFVLELPPYRFPTFQGLFIHTWEKTWHYIKKAGTVILGISILLWAMMTFPALPETDRQVFEDQRQQMSDQVSPLLFAELEGTTEPSIEALALYEDLLAVDGAEAEAALRYSVAGRIGTAMERISWLPGFDWRTNIALLGGFAAKEVIISTLGTSYSLGQVDPEASESLAATLGNDPGWDAVKALSVIIFVMFYAPCFVTVACIIKEAGSWKWGVFSITFNTFFAFLLSTLVYQVGSRLF